MYGTDVLLQLMYKLFNRFLLGEFPDKWEDFIIIPKHKKGSVNSPNNHRGKALLDVLIKIYIHIHVYI